MHAPLPSVAVPAAIGELNWTHRLAALGPRFYTELPPAGLPDPHWVATSADCARLLGWPATGWQTPEALRVFSGNALWPGMRPLASVYSGHQFGVWAGQLGDGRALWLGELDTPQGPMELQLKGAGRTPYSRMGDGRAVLRSSIREFLASEAMAALGIPTTRALALTASTALPVRRETTETAAIVTRVAPSFLRFGHVEHFAHHGLHDELRELVQHLIEHHAPQCQAAPQPVVALLAQVATQTADLLAHWQAVGFCHGVMNTDNMSLLGLSIDYGPYGFLDGFDPGHVCNHSDTQGRYAFARQPQVAYWNLHALAQALLPLVPGDEEAAAALLREALQAYPDRFAQAMLLRMRAKLGLREARDGDGALVDDWLRLLAATRVDYSIAHRRLGEAQLPAGAEGLRDLFLDREALDAWLRRYRDRLAQEPEDPAQRRAAMHAVNPAVVLRNHLAETAIRQAEAGDFSEVQRLLEVLSHPFDAPERAADADFPPDWAQHIEVSCSS